MECVLLGSGGMMPMPYRALTSLVLRHEGRLYLFDAGEGAQVGLKAARLGIKAMRVMAVSHLHGDHCLGLPGLLMMRAQLPDPEPLTIVGPPGIQRFVTQTHESLGFYVNYPVEFVEWQEGGREVAYEDDLIRILWAPLRHTTVCLGFRLEEHPRPGKFKTEAAKALGIPPGPLFGRLQGGERVVLEDGRVIAPGQVLGPSRPGRTICFAVDTRPTKTLYRLCKDADVAFLDGMFLPQHEEEAEQKGHMTVDDAARVASRAGVRRAILVHISPRYQGEEDEEQLSRAAADRFDRAEMGKDLGVYVVPFPDRPDSDPL
ncbi:MAG: ribonuclease Z [Thermodesulfobacteriota bacterium]